MSGQGKYVAYVGTYTHSNSIGIHVYDVNVQNGVLTERSVTPINNASYLCLSHDGTRLYSIADEGVASFIVDENGDLEKMNQAWIGGMRGCYLDIDSKRQYLYVGGYHDGRVTMMHLNEDGSVGDIADGIFHQGVAISSDERRLDHPKVSCVKLTPDEKYLCAADYGLNQIKVYRVDYQRGKLKLEDIIRCTLDAAPRFMHFSKDGRFLYVLTELNYSLEIYSYQEDDGEPSFELIQSVCVLDKEYQTATATGLAFSNDEQYIYISVDGLNGVSCFERHPEDGTVSFESNTLCSGDYPKSIAVLPDGKYYAVLNHDTNDIRVFEPNHAKKYALMKNKPVKIDKPNCIRIYKF